MFLLPPNQFQMEAVVDATEGSEAPPPTLPQPQDKPPTVEGTTAEVSAPSPPQDALSRKGGEEKEAVKVCKRRLFCWLAWSCDFLFWHCLWLYSHFKSICQYGLL